MKSPLLSLPGAVAADPPDEDVAAHYGEPFAEQRALASGAAFVDRGDRGVVRVAGADRLRYLHSITSQHLESLPPYAPVEALLLSPHGHVEHHLTLVDDGEAVWAHVEPGTAPDLVRFLDSMRFMMRVEVTDESGAYAVVTLSGAEPPEGALVTTDGLIVPRADLERDWGVRPAGLWAYEALRIAAHRPRPGIDTDHRTIPHETGWSAPPSTSTRAATAARRRSPGCRTWAARPGAWCSCIWTAASTGFRCAARRSRPAAARSDSWGRPPATTSSGRSRSAWSSATCRSTRRWSPAASRPRRRSSSLPTRAPTSRSTYGAGDTAIT